MDLDESYEGRGHFTVKHELLRGYLEKLLFIIGVRGVKEIAYVNYFAGLWGDEFRSLQFRLDPVQFHSA